MPIWGGDTTRTPEPAEVILNALDAFSRELRVSMVAQVQSYDATKQRASLQPLTKRPFINSDGTEGIESRPVISDVPVFFPRGGGMTINWVLQQGDTGLLVFLDQSLDIWKQNGGEVDPIDLRTHHISDAVFFAGFGSNSGKLQSQASSGQINIGEDGASGDMVATAQRVLTQLQNIVTAFNEHQHTAASVPTSPPIAVSTVIPIPAPTAPGSSTVNILG